ncbi:MAG TPA: hypothetical protein ENH01_10105 [Nitrospirae bacterium]|nr:hypothetical protein [Nitrospirota bacterium]
MIKKALLINILALFLMSTITEGANWLYFIENERGDKFYIDMESIRHTSRDTIRVLKKVEPGNSSKISSLVSDIELDCKGCNPPPALEKLSFTEQNKVDSPLQTIQP